MIFLCPFLHCKALKTAMYKRYINFIIIIIFLESGHDAGVAYFNVIVAINHA